MAKQIRLNFSTLIVLLILISLIVFLQVKLILPDFQVSLLIILAGIAFWQGEEFLALLTALTGLWTLFLLYNLELQPLILMMILAGSLLAWLTFWQYHHLLLSAMIGVLTAQAVGFFAYWIDFNQPLDKAILLTILTYLMWNFSGDGREPDGSSLISHCAMAVLLSGLVLVTMKPILDMTLH